MFKSTSKNGRSGGNTTIVEATQRRHQARKAKTALVVTWFVIGQLSATIAADYTHPILALFLGAFLGLAAGLAVGFVVLAWPYLRIVWHWLPEIMLGIAVIYGWQLLMAITTAFVAVLVLAVTVGIPAAVGPIRRRIIAGAWCLIVRHRLRVCFASFIATNRQGTLPFILWAHPTPAGERVWIWLRPGLALSDLEGRLDKVAVACWAAEARVTKPAKGKAAYLRIDITRRNPLAATVASPLPALVPEHLTPAMTGPMTGPVDGEWPSIGLDLPDISEDLANLTTGLTPGLSVKTPAATRTAGNTDPTPATRIDDANDWI